MRKWLSNYFGISEREARGFLVFVLLFVLFLAVPSLVKWLWPPTPLNLTLTQSRYLDSLWASKKYRPSYHSEVNEEVPSNYSIRAFDPNTVSVEEMQGMGFPSWLARRIDKYRQAGGFFRKPEDFQRIYGFPAPLWAAVQDSLVFPDRRGRPRFESEPSEVPLATLDMNAADSTAWEALPGIGPGFARRIVEYRQRLGGFQQKEQLYEVYEIDSLLVERLLPRLVLGEASIKKLDINSASEQTLRRHPYMPWKAPKLIVAYRRQHGPFAQVEDLKALQGLSWEQMQKVLPYLEAR